MKRIALVCSAFVLMAGVGLLVACSGSPVVSNAVAQPSVPERISQDDPEAWLKVMDENPVDYTFVDALSSFSYRSTASTFAADDGEAANSMFSPLSLYYALAIAGEGAAGQTSAEIEQTLGMPAGIDIPVASGSLFRQIATDPYTQIDLANSLWMAKECMFEQDFINMATNQFYATPFSVEFGAPETDQAIASWISENTGATINPQVETEKSQLLSIINTVHFKDGWRNPFDASGTTKAPFHAEDGDAETDFMTQRLDGLQEYRRTDTYERASLSFAGGARMTFVLPAEGVSAMDMIADEAALSEAFTSDSDASAFVTYTVPKASFDSSYDLIPSLRGMGMETPFGTDADFSRLTPEPAYISSVKQESFVSWDENGAEASAYTNIGISKTSAMPEEGEEVDFRLDRPFLFQISTSQGIPLFVGVCGNPAA